MKKKRPGKLSLHKETVRTLESSELPVFGAESGQLACIETFPYSACGTTCDLSCRTCFEASCFPCDSVFPRCGTA